MGPPGVTSIHTRMLPSTEGSIRATAATRNVTPLRLGVGPPRTSHQSLLTLPSFPPFARGAHLDGFLHAFSSRLWFLGARRGCVHRSLYSHRAFKLKKSSKFRLKPKRSGFIS